MKGKLVIKPAAKGWQTCRMYAIYVDINMRLQVTNKVLWCNGEHFGL